jgi:ribosome-associated protein
MCTAIDCIPLGQNPPVQIPIRGEYIELQQLLKLAGVVGTGGEAKDWIAAGRVSVNGEVERRRSRKVRSGDVVRVEGVADVMEVVAEGS